MSNDKIDKVPMYQNIMDDIVSRITNGELQPHDPLPTQIELAKQYGTSEITSRRALSDLVQEGYIYRIRGKGSFVQDHRMETSRKAIRTIYFVHRSEQLIDLHHRFFGDLLAGIENVCEDNGVSFYLWDDSLNHSLPDDADAGIILLTDNSLNISKLAGWKEEGRRIVTVHFYFPHLNIPYVIVDNLTGGYLATQHLLSLGHRQIGIILTGESILELNQEFSLRLQGYRLALSQHQIPFDPDLVCVIHGDNEHVHMGFDGFKQLMDRPIPPTAVFATSDYKAVGAMKAAHKLGLRIPEDVSVIGYDDAAISRYVYPHLTTVNQNTRKLGVRAAEILLFEQKDSETEFVKDEIVPTIVIRESTAPPNPKKVL